MQLSPIKITTLAGYGVGGRTYNAPIFSSIKGFLVKKALTFRNKAAAQRDFPRAEVTQEYQRILSDHDVAPVIIPTPPFLHHSFAEKALKAEKHVVLEKLMTQ